MKSVGSQSFDQKLKRLGFLHWEKVLVAVAILGVAAFCWFGYVKPYDKTTPSKLRQSVDEARRYIQRDDSWTQIADFRKANDQAVEVIAAEKTVDYQSYSMPRLLGTKAATRGLRSDPAIKSPLEPRAQVVVGSVLVKRPETATGTLVGDWWTELVIQKRQSAGSSVIRNSGNEEDADLLMRRGGARPQVTEKKPVEQIVVIPDLMKTEFAGLSPVKLGVNNDDHTSLVVSAVAVTGLFPHELQFKEFANLEGAIKFNKLRDQPYYVYLQIERRKRVDGKETEWQDITRYVTEDLLKNVYAVSAPEVVEEPYVDPYLTVKIPPFVWKDYKTFCASEKTPVIVEKPKTNNDAVDVTSRQRITINDFNTPTETNVDDAEEKDEKDKIAQYKLIRFFDMSVSPNEEVQYRFRVWLADPNNPHRQVYDRVWNKQQLDAAQGGAAAAGEGEAGEAGVARGSKAGGARQGGNNPANASGTGDPYDLSFTDVAPEVRKRLKEQESQPDPPGPIKFLKYARPSEWSEPTNWVRVPQANAEVVAGRVNAGLQQNIRGVVYSDDEPQVDVVVKKWDPALQVQIPVERKVMRGTVMNFRSPAKVVNPIDRQLYDVKRDLIEEGSDENGVKFATNSFIVDMLGGQKMPYSTADKTYYKPSEILVMREDGQLELRDELGDRMAFRHGTFADDELLTDVAPVVKEDKPKENAEGLGRGRGRGGQ